MSRRKGGGTNGRSLTVEETNSFTPTRRITRNSLRAQQTASRSERFEFESSIQSHPSTYSTYSENLSVSETDSTHHHQNHTRKPPLLTNSKQEEEEEGEEEQEGGGGRNGHGNGNGNSGVSDGNHSQRSNDQALSPVAKSIENSHLTPEEERKCREAAENYIANCKYYHVTIDPSVVIALQTGWKVLQPSSRFAEGSMLPLKNILEVNDVITKLNLSNVGMQDSRYRAAGNGNANARILNFILQRNQTIEELDLSNTGLDDDGVREICEGLKENQKVKKVNLARNHFGVEGANYLSHALETNQSIHSLDLTSNALGYHSINSLLCICQPKRVHVNTQGNYVFEEILNSVSHGVAFLGAVIGANILIAEATDKYHTDYHFWASVIYSFALMFLFLSSCLFHSFFMLPSTMRVLQILDHVGIYLVIAGTYTPILLVALHQHSAATVLLIFEWIAALLGIFFATCADLNNPNSTKVELTLFLGMGFGLVLVWDTLYLELSKQALILLFLGGGFYVVGIVFFILGEFRPIYHVIWHLFVVIAACVHWFAIYFFVLQVSLENSPTRTAVTEFADSVYGAAEAFDSLVNRTLSQMQ